MEKLNFSRDVYSFANSSNSFWGCDEDELTSDDNFLDIGSGFSNHLAYTLRQQYGDGFFDMYEDLQAFARQKWNRACFGMSATVALDKLGKIDVNGNVSNDINLANLDAPAENGLLRDIIHYYHILQVMPHLYMNEEIGTPFYDDFLEEAIGLIDSQGLVMICYAFEVYEQDDGNLVPKTVGHCVVAYDYELITGDIYRISIYDPSYPDGTTYLTYNSVSGMMYKSDYTEDITRDGIDDNGEAFCMAAAAITDFDNFDIFDIDDYHNTSLIGYLESGLTRSQNSEKYVAADDIEGSSCISGKAQIIIPIDTICQIVNDKGEALVLESGELSGNMQVYNCWPISIGDTYLSILVEDSSSFCFSSQKPLIYFSVVQNGVYSRVSGENIETIDIGADTINISGNGIIYDVKSSKGIADVKHCETVQCKTDSVELTMSSSEVDK